MTPEDQSRTQSGVFPASTSNIMNINVTIVSGSDRESHPEYTTRY